MGHGIAGVILAGGRATRLDGAVKLLIEIDGVRIVDRIRGVLEPLVDDLIIAGEAPGLDETGLRVVPDRRPGLGPLGGLEAALTATRSEAILLVAGDMPFLEARALTRLRDADPAAAAVCFATERGPEPLCARYARRILSRVSARLDENRLAMHELLVELGALHLVPRDEQERRSLTNLNTAADLAARRP